MTADSKVIQEALSAYKAGIPVVVIGIDKGILHGEDTLKQIREYGVGLNCKVMFGVDRAEFEAGDGPEILEAARQVFWEWRRKQDLLLYSKELKRQFENLRRLGIDVDEVVEESPEAQAFISNMEDFNAGRITAEQAAANIKNITDLTDNKMRDTGDPGLITVLDAESEALQKFSEMSVAVPLVRDAVLNADRGVTKEDWILEVLTGHGEDEDAQLCLKIIIALWERGPWPWPRNL